MRNIVRRHPTMLVGGALLVAMVLMAILAPYLFTYDPRVLNPIHRLRPPEAGHWFGTDMFGRDVYSRTIYGARISLVVGFSVSILATSFGMVIGLMSGYNRVLDAIIMRIMDGLMSIPAILLAIALMALMSASVKNVIIAITIPEIPRVVRLVRALVLSLREQPFVEAASAMGAGFLRTMFRHIMPNTLAPLIVQGTYIMASAVIIEAYLSFLGAGTPPDVPSWGNIMAEGRTYVQIGFWIILFPGICLALTVLGINLLGDGLRDTLDPRIARRM
ncbi:MAG TPA: ABC transporter permease [bacterium]|nr:ABC transporter permease [bacterium]